MTPVLPSLRGTCRTCKHFDQGEKTDGICRAHAPQVSVIMVVQAHPITRQPMQQHQVVANFPPVGDACWCGEWAGALTLSMNG